MARRRLLSDDFWAQHLAPPTDERAIARHHTFGPDDLSQIATKRGDVNRQAVLRAEALSAPDLTDPTADLIARHKTVRLFGPLLLDTFAFERVCEKGQTGARRPSMTRIEATSISASEVCTRYS
jgi:hypothetical protein